MPSAVEYAYLAGIIDGEGSVMLNKSGNAGHHRLVVVVVNTDLRLLEWIMDRFDGRLLVTNPAKKNHKTQYRVQWESLVAAALLNELLPYLVIKREQAEVALRFAQTTTAGNRTGRRGLSEDVRETRGECVAQIRYLNRRGA